MRWSDVIFFPYPTLESSMNNIKSKLLFQSDSPTRAVVAALLLSFAALGHAQLVDVTAEVGLSDIRLRGGHEGSGGGIFADLDGDGYPDLVLPGGPGEPTMIYHNQPGHQPGQRVFEEILLDNGRAYGATGAIAGDYDGDGDLDIYVTTHSATMGSPCPPYQLCSPNRLYENYGNMNFHDVTGYTRLEDPQNGVPNTGVSHSIWSDDEDPYQHGFPVVLDNAMAAAWADVDRDGDLDLYVGNHDGSVGNPVEDAVTYGQRDILFMNIDHRYFGDVSELYGICGYVDCDPDMSSPRRFGSAIAAVFADLNNDQWPDLIVVNNTGGLQDADLVYWNLGADEQGDWMGFQARLLPRPIGASSTGLSIGDADNDGDLDFFKAGTSSATFYESLVEQGSAESVDVAGDARTRLGRGLLSRDGGGRRDPPPALSRVASGHPRNPRQEIRSGQ